MSNAENTFGNFPKTLISLHVSSNMNKIAKSLYDCSIKVFSNVHWSV